MNNRKKVIALEGAINASTDDVAISWRNAAISRLGHKYDFHNPMDFDCRGREEELRDELVRYDEVGMTRSDLALVNHPKPSTGTDIGIQFMYTLHRHIVVVCPDLKPSPWLVSRANKIFKTMEEALWYLDAL